jgi:riboflavin synthase
MFTGIVEQVGTIAAVRRGADGLECTVQATWNDLVLGESIAVDGACLTVQSIGAGTFDVHVIATSLERTNFAAWTAGRRVNLERALRIGDRLGGHLVQGHVDAVGEVTAVSQQGDAWLIDLAVPEAVMRVSIPLGSITVDGVSLTVNALEDPCRIQISLIPFTLGHTTLGDRQPGDRVHLEGDTIGKYVERLLPARRSVSEAGQ